MLMPDWLYPIAMIIVGVLGPTLTINAIYHKSRGNVLREIKSTLSHVDECVDDLKVKVEGYTARAVTRDEVDAKLLRQRESVQQDTKGLHDRITRLETPYFVKVAP